MRWLWWDLRSVFGVGMGGISPFSIWKSSFFNAIIMWLFCIDVVVWCFCFLFIVAFAHVYTCLFITCPCLSVCILCSYATCMWPEFIFNKVMFCSVLLKQLSKVLLFVKLSFQGSIYYILNNQDLLLKWLSKVLLFVNLTLQDSIYYTLYNQIYCWSDFPRFCCLWSLLCKIPFITYCIISFVYEVDFPRGISR